MLKILPVGQASLWVNDSDPLVDPDCHANEIALERPLELGPSFRARRLARF